jgi:hypothetical protein
MHDAVLSRCELDAPLSSRGPRPRARSLLTMAKWLRGLSNFGRPFWCGAGIFATVAGSYVLFTSGLPSRTRGGAFD